MLQEIFGDNIQASILIILNLIFIEVVLSFDNAAVLATMVRDLPREQQPKALRYGILGAYFFRGICLLLASYIVKIWWLKPLGGAYLLYLAYSFFKGESTPEQTDDYDYVVKKESWFYKMTVGSLGVFWSTVVTIELMDLMFSIDNVIAVVAYTKNIYLICFGVFVGILAMRFVTQWFAKLMEYFPFLESIAFVVIAILGVKLLLSIYSHFNPHTPIAEIIDGEHSDMILSVITISCFALPVITSWLFNYPQKTNVDK